MGLNIYFDQYLDVAAMLRGDGMHMALKKDQKSSWKYTVPDVNHT